MNGDLVGEWTTSRSGNPIFRYTEPWVKSPQARALSLSIPFTEDREVRGPQVDHYFDNLLPDNPAIRNRIRDRFGLRSTDAFDLLQEIGRDCVGAVQLLPLSQEPTGWNSINAKPLSTADVGRLLREVSAPPPLGRRADADTDAFRISIAGAQEKTALLSMRGSWFSPQGSTPSNQILKLPLGIIGNFRGDFSHSVENEWLCAKIARELGLSVAATEMGVFGEQKALIVKRFDRRWVGVDEQVASSPTFTPAPGTWIARLPQEDFCQATGRSPAQRYETDGGPTIAEILEILGRGEQPDEDRAEFVLAQVLFWLLAAPDGHGKNFSIYHRRGGSFTLTPLYDVLSAWPVIGHGANQLRIQDAKLAMAICGRNRHYKIVEIQTRHWRALAERTGGEQLWVRMRRFVEAAEAAVARIQTTLPPDFPEVVIRTIVMGVRGQVRKFLSAPE
jgi:serine/threonine-protein kinase HipA